MPELSHEEFVANRLNMDAGSIPQAMSGTMNGVEKKIPPPIECESCGEQIWLIDVKTDDGNRIVAIVERCSEYPPEEEVFWAHVCGLG